MAAQDSFLFGARYIVIAMIVFFIAGAFIVSERSWDIQSAVDAPQSIVLENLSPEPLLFTMEEVKSLPVGMIQPGGHREKQLDGGWLYTVKIIDADGRVVSERMISVIDKARLHVEIENGEYVWTEAP